MLQSTPVEAFEYQEQTLQPLSEPNTQPQRLLAPKIKTYPFLNQLELLLYPSQNFKSENPSQRLERLEMAVFGTKQHGNISTRLNNLKEELDNWQIGNMQAMKNTKQNSERLQPNIEREKITYPNYNNPNTTPLAAAVNIQRPVTRDYQYMNYRLATPLLQNIGRRTIDAFFN